jgi:hypothetical protein
MMCGCLVVFLFLELSVRGGIEMTRRKIEHAGREWSLSALAIEHGLAVGTLAYRLDVRRLPVGRALATGVQTPGSSARRRRRRWLR